MIIGAYGDLDLRGTGLQKNHLNQNAAFNTRIDRSEGIAIAMKGNAVTDIDTPHYNFHESLESFWNKYRKGGEFSGTTPTSGQYGAAVEKALVAAGYKAPAARAIQQFASDQRATARIGVNEPVPNIPKPMGQKKRP